MALTTIFSRKNGRFQSLFQHNFFLRIFFFFVNFKALFPLLKEARYTYIIRNSMNEKCIFTKINLFFSLFKKFLLF